MQNTLYKFLTIIFYICLYLTFHTNMYTRRQARTRNRLSCRLRAEYIRSATETVRPSGGELSSISGEVTHKVVLRVPAPHPETDDVPAEVAHANQWDVRVTRGDEYECPARFLAHRQSRHAGDRSCNTWNTLRPIRYTLGVPITCAACPVRDELNDEAKHQCCAMFSAHPYTSSDKTCAGSL